MSTPADDLVFRALAHPDRRAILDLLRVRSLPTGQVAAHFPTSRYAVMKHLDLLEGAGLVWVERRGRLRLHHLNPVPIQQIARRWIRPYEALADGATDAPRPVGDPPGDPYQGPP